MRLKDKVAVITGAGGGLGSVAANRFCLEGAKVVVNDINADRGQKVVNDIKESGGNAVFVEADIRKVEECKKLIKSAVDAFGRVDVLFNNAGLELMKSLHEYSEEDYESVVGLHLKGSFFCIRYVLPVMMDRGGGSIINMGSIAGLSGFIKEAAYCAAKGGLVNLTRYVALEYAPYNIRCNCICPGVVATEMIGRVMEQDPDLVQKSVDMHPMGRMAKPEEIADATVFLASDEASFITGVSLPVDGGYLAGKV